MGTDFTVRIVAPEDEQIVSAPEVSSTREGEARGSPVLPPTQIPLKSVGVSATRLRQLGELKEAAREINELKVAARAADVKHATVPVVDLNVAAFIQLTAVDTSGCLSPAVENDRILHAATEGCRFQLVGVDGLWLHSSGVGGGRLLSTAIK